MTNQAHKRSDATGSIRLFGYDISNRGLTEDVNHALELIGPVGAGRYMACANPHSMVVASQDPVFREALEGADILVPDGFGVVVAARFLSLPLQERVTGYEFFIGLSRLCDERGGVRYFFLGSNDHVLNRILTCATHDFPSVVVCGTYSPPFKEEFSEEDIQPMIDAVNSSHPDVLWVGMTAPKQEKWIYQNRGRIDVPFIAAIGAVFDFYAGTKARSSLFWQRLGLEWLPRFLKEPRRLWSRNMRSTPVFLSWMIREKLRLLGK